MGRAGGLRGQGWGPGCGRPCFPQVLEVLECIPPLLLLLLACGLDHTLFTMLSIIQQHSFVQYSFHSEPTAPQPHSNARVIPPSTLLPSPTATPPNMLLSHRQPPLGCACDGHVPDGSAPAEHHRGPQHLLRHPAGDVQRW